MNFWNGTVSILKHNIQIWFEMYFELMVFISIYKVKQNGVGYYRGKNYSKKIKIHLYFALPSNSVYLNFKLCYNRIIYT